MHIKSMKVNKKGMITIPNDIREKYNIVEGSEVLVVEINGAIQIIPILNFDKIKELLPSRKKMKEVYIKSREEEMELED
ncbi:MAG: AbrB/MazE/SpoVT family DNA-binding domain-containing protein [Promethearchaeota archaeon]|nr:MAG: AbrB/MazE/SpoVT family DNA-binding domain-containing protein [Candidatus Lokiarchaeota archaeon]